MKTYLEHMPGLGIRVDWWVMLVGIEGAGRYPFLIESDELMSFAEQELARAALGDPILKDLVSLLDLSEATLGATKDVVKKLALRSEGSRERANAAWALATLDSAHEWLAGHIQDDPFFAAMELEYAWNDLRGIAPQLAVRDGAFRPGDAASGAWSVAVVEARFARSRAWVRREAALLGSR